MKQTMLMTIGAVTIFVLAGCQSAYVNNYGFGSTMPGIIYSGQTRGSFMLPKAESMANVEVLGPVCGKSSGQNILLLWSIGDCGIEAAKQDALRNYPNADDVLNVEIDTKHESILCVLNNTTTILRGIAIKYKTVKK